MTDSQRKPRIEKCQCGICEELFTDGTVVKIARRIAKHWNEEHGDELAGSETPYKTEKYGGEHMYGNQYRYRLYKYYITAYDVLDNSGDTCGPFAYQYVKKIEGEVCEDCWRSIHGVDGYQELDTDGWRDKYLCDECARERQIKRRESENEQITKWCA